MVNKMYISDKYWDNYIGETDDSLTLVQYLADKNKQEISLKEVLSDIGLDKLNGNFRNHEEPLTVVLKNIASNYEEPYVEFYYAVDVITDLAALMLECKVNGTVNLCELIGDDLETSLPYVKIIATQEENRIIKEALADFVSTPLDYDLSEMCAEEEMLEMAKVCEELMKELYGESEIC